MAIEDPFSLITDPFSKVIQQVMENLRSMDYIRDLRMLRQEAYVPLHEAGFDMQVVLAMDPDKALIHLREEKKFTDLQLEKLGDLLWEVTRADGSLIEEMDEERHAELALAYALYQELNRTSLTYSLERERRMRWLEAKRKRR